MEKLKVMSLFSGIGAFEAALRNIGAEFEVVGFSEIDKYAIKSYCAIHNVDESLNYGDVSKIEKVKLPDFDILVGGSPCQSFSVAGQRKGFEDTRGTLFFQYIETLKEKQPKYFVFENVKGLINHDKGNTLNIMASAFSEVGYRIDMELLNSKYFNVPQNRERIFIVGIREDIIENCEWTVDLKRKDVLAKGKKRLKEFDLKTMIFRWPNHNEIKKVMKEILEDFVDDKYYLSKDKTEKLVSQLEKNGGAHSFKKQEEMNREIDPIMIGHVELKGHEAIRRVYSPRGMSPTLTTMGGGHREPKILLNEIPGSKSQPKISVIGTTLETGAKGTNSRHWIHEADFNLIGTIDATTYKQPKQIFGESTNYRIRKLTPLECWRLQAFDDKDFEKAIGVGVSNTQLYKQAGNSITVTVLEEIFKELLHTYK
ncbi:DNA (cytosine-5-)-methyltransferase [Bacillus pumilus]|uniref:DNA (cytosine-5-)-methyltransferase n=1 Tax=Bacillus pumilus TaxID=1408 RepID=UPI00119CBE5E|nr:DNA (cytosine-5-)-methyltransferase [Bacillus pumilus]